MTFRLLTLNLWNINEPLEPRYHALAAELEKLRPDIVCLQEVDRDMTSGRSQAGLVGEMCHLNHHVGENGLSIISSQRAVHSAIEPLPQLPDDPPREVLLAELMVEARHLLVVNTHLAYQPKMVEGRWKQTQAVLTAIRRHHPKPVECPTVLCGDFNDVAEFPPFVLSWMTEPDSATPFPNVTHAVVDIPIRRKILTSSHHGPKLSVSTIFF